MAVLSYLIKLKEMFVRNTTVIIKYMIMERR